MKSPQRGESQPHACAGHSALHQFQHPSTVIVRRNFSPCRRWTKSTEGLYRGPVSRNGMRGNILFRFEIAQEFLPVTIRANWTAGLRFFGSNAFQNFSDCRRIVVVCGRPPPGLVVRMGTSLRSGPSTIWCSNEPSDRTETWHPSI